MVSKIAIIGANGKIATEVIQKLLNHKDKYETTAFIRSKEQISKFEKIGIKYSTDIDLVESSLESITRALNGFDIIIYSAGSGGNGLDNTFAVDLDGAVRISEAATIIKAKRFILVSAIHSQDRSWWWNSPLRSYYIAKKYADDVISSNDELNWTILQPGYLKDDEAKGKILDPNTVNSLSNDINDPNVNITISRKDVAQVILESLTDKSTIKKFIPLLEGDLEIKEALRKL
ncbi:hypothetical protein BN7_5230 [Wickerhamomyces ciferrii]|uniref:NAD(P)-binding domain-containing protein n=1 Tax=Wickerhamomyces ciferrii (strain ATCC 14091 / BCRC 22168 / CBS 111 / JCM 3599 / NBRC 0793 / NRRL Y-1031 F-60-10) TaxID=1206466 RepID=K0KK93_WICCF|nr:uncharacterized protein BN7_5230 [Wickerhamomyces ciferrii]CCH45645.1 hypothetical protein BN7_5230 [Wickerhamomyces ciferrii]